MLEQSRMAENYRVTEVGIIPKEWRLVRLGDLGYFSKGAGIKKDQSSSGSIPCVRYGELYTKHDNIISDYYSFISRDVAETSKRLKTGEILFAGSGETKEEIGKCVAFTDEIEAYAGGDIVIFTPSEGISDFLGYILNAPFSIKQKASKGQGDAIVHISSSNLADVLLPLPSEREQKAIAEVLTDTDNLIKSLDKLIAKKQKIKQGTMQELLTGKKRLPGFSDDWTKYELGELLEYEQPTKYIVKSTDYITNGTPVLTPGKSFILGYTNEDFGVYSKVPVIIFDDFTTVSKYVTFPFKVKSSAMKMLKLKNPTNSLRLIYEMMQILKFTKGDHKRYWISEFSKLKVSLPTTKEQKAIAQVISDMDAEIVALEEKLEKYKGIKQGMMQELLTGRIRLI